MKTHQRFAFPLTAIAAALLAAFGPARAEQADEVKELITPSSEVSLGLGYVDNENQRWGKFTGMTENGIYGLLDIDFVNRNDETGTWTRLLGRNLGLDDREFRFEQNRQSNWRYFLEYSQLPFNQPLTIITRTGGIGSPFQTPAGAAAPVKIDLSTEREILTVGANKWFGKKFDLALTFRNEEKEGNRRWGNQGSAPRGTPTFPNFLAEPVDWETNQLDAVFGYNGEKLQLQLGYYGTTFDNSNNKVDVLGVNPGQTPLSLPPDSQSHQGYLSGGYSFTPTTRANFKVSYTSVEQNEAFFQPIGNLLASPIPGPRGTGRTSLDGKVDTTLAQAGIISRPIPKLTLRADWRYEDRNDDTPRFQYIDPAATGGVACTPPTCSRDGYNVILSRLTSISRAEAQYMLPMGFRIIGGVDYEHRDREITPGFRQVSWRAETEEWSYRVELNRSLAETINGRLSYVYSDRDGSDYEPANNAFVAGVPVPDVIDPIHWADRKRDKWRLRLDWVPVEELSVQFTADYAQDKYDGRPLGPESGQYEFYGLDANYVLSDKWQLVGWVSTGATNFHQRSIGAAATGVPQSTAETGSDIWFAPLDNTSDAIGVGVRGRPSAKWEVGADLQYSEDQDEFNLIGNNLGSLALPEITNRHTTVSLFGKYALQPNAGVKLQYIYDRWSTNDWAWQIFPFAFFSNGTVVFNESPQQVHFIGASYYYEWR